MVKVVDAEPVRSGRVASTPADTVKEGAVHDVTHFGAVGDGACHGEHAAFTSALAAAGTRGTVYVPPGTYKICSSTPLVLRAGVSLRGSGEDVTKILRGYNGDSQLLHAMGNNTISAITIDDDYASNPLARPKGSAVVVRGSRVVFERFGIIRGASNTGVQIVGNVGDIHFSRCRLQGAGAPGVGSYMGVWALGGGNSDITFDRCDMQDYDWSAIFSSGPTRITSSYFRGNHRQTSPTGGGQIATGDDLVATGNIIEAGGGSATSGLELNGRSTVIGNYIADQGNFGVAIQAGHDFVIRGNTILRSGSVFGGIGVAPGTVRFQIIGNTLRDNSGWGVFVAAGASDDYAITSNDFSDNGSGTINDGGTGTRKVVDDQSLMTARGPAVSQ